MDTASNSCEASRELGSHVLVCGSYGPSQAAAAFFAAAGSSSVFCLKKEEAARWNEALGDEEFVLTHSQGEVVKAKPTLISDDPKVAELADAVVLSVPRGEHPDYIAALAPFLKKEIVVVVTDIRPGDDIALRAKVPEVSSLTVVGSAFQLWRQCAILDWGRKATLPTYTNCTTVGLNISATSTKAFEVLQHLLSVFPPETHYCDSFLSLSLRSPFAPLHPGLVYGRWCPERWDGRPVQTKPLYHHGIDAFSEYVLQSLSNEVQALKERLEERVPAICLKDVCTLREWLVENYEGQLCETSTLQDGVKVMDTTSTGTHVCKEHEGMYLPDFSAPRLVAHLKNGLCFNKGLGEILGVAMPMTDKVICWAQERVGLCLMIDGQLCGKDLHQTRAPQAFGICNLPSFLKASGLQAPLATQKAQEQLFKNIGMSGLSDRSPCVETTFAGRASLKFVEHLAAGAYGQVSLFQHEHSGHWLVAKKSLRKRADRSILREARALRDLKHPHIVTFLGQCVEADGRPMAIYQFYEGGDLATRMKRPVGKVLFNSWIANVASAVAYLHSEKVLHRDIKPLNIYLGPCEELYLGDFGDCRKVSPHETKVMTKAGTIGFQSPEAQQGRGYFYPSDIWAMGQTFLLVQHFAGMEPSILVDKMLRDSADTRPTAQEVFEEADEAYKASQAARLEPKIAFKKLLQASPDQRPLAQAARLKPKIAVKKLLQASPDQRPLAQAARLEPKIAVKKLLQASPDQRPLAQEVFDPVQHQTFGAAQAQANPAVAAEPFPGVITSRVVHVVPSYSKVPIRITRIDNNCSKAALPRLLGKSLSPGPKVVVKTASPASSDSTRASSGENGSYNSLKPHSSTPARRRREVVCPSLPSWLSFFCA